MNSNVKLSLAAVLILIAVWRLVGCGGGQPKVAPVAFKHYESLASTAARIVADNIPGGEGAVVLVVDESDSQALNRRETVFQKTASSLGLRDVVVIKALPGEWSSEAGWSPSLLQKVLNEAPENRCVVSFVGPPPGRVLKQSSARTISPYFLAILPSTGNLDAFMQAGIVHDAVVPANLKETPSVSPTRSDQDWFEAYYELYLPSSAAVSPAAVSGEVISAPGSADEVQY